MSTTASQLHIRLFLEGVEVPVISADVQSTLDGPGTSASIQVVATPEVGRLRPRTLVHLFFLDVSTEGTYRLLFSGEVVGVSVSKTESSRNASLDCRDFRSYFDAAYTYFMTNDTLRGGGEGTTAILKLLQSQAAFTGATTGFSNVASNQTELLISSILNDPKPKSWGFQDTKGLLGGLIQIIETFTGIAEIGKAGANQFFSFAEARLHLLAQLGLYEADETAKRLFSAEAMINFMAQRLESLGDLVTLSQIIEMILRFIYYRIAPNPCALYQPPSRVSKEGAAPFRDPALALRAIISGLRSELGGLGQSALQFAITELRKLTPGDVRNRAVSQGTFRLSLDQRDLQTATSMSTQAPELNNLLRACIDSDVSIQAQAVSIANQISNIAASGQQLAELKVALEELEKALTSLSSASVRVEVDYTARLPTTLILPDLFFGVAPQCNVIYPDMYYTLQYSRDMLREVTRLHLSTDIGDLVQGAIAGGEVYYAPSVEALSEVQSKPLTLPNAGVAPDATATVGRLFEHELNTGIIPAFTTMSRMSKEMAGGLQDTNTKLDYFTRIANMQFLQQRLAARTLSVSGVFNPYIAVGFPAVVLDKGVGATSTQRGSISKSDIEDLEQYVGLCVSVSHSVNQTGGSTSYQMQYARPHRSQDDSYLEELAFRTEVEPTVQEVLVDSASIFQEVVDLLTQGRDEAKEADLVSRFRFLINSSTGYVGKRGEDYIGEINAFIDMGKLGRRTSNVISYFGSQRSKVISAVVEDVSPVGGSRVSGGEGNAVSIVSLSEASAIKEAGEVWYNVRKPDVAIQLLGGTSAPYLLVKSVISAARASGYTAKQETLSDQQLLALMYIYGSSPTRLRFPIPAYTSVRVSIEVPSGEVVRPPVEEAMRPLYLDPVYASPNIGNGLYRPLLGVGSVVDIKDGELAGYGVEKMKTVVGVTSSTSIRHEQIDVVSQEDAIDILTLKYAEKGTSEYWVSAVRRPIASLDEVLGEGGFHDLAHATQGEAGGSKAIPLLGAALRVPDGAEVPAGVREVSADDISRLSASVDTRIDTRADRKTAVLRYVNSLTSRGLLG